MRTEPRALSAWPKACVLIAALVALSSSGCSVLPVTPASLVVQRDALAAFALEGRFSLRQADKNYSGRLSWRHDGANNELLLASPFGQGMAQITTSASGARITMADGKAYSAADAETLTQQLLGYSLPLAHLTDWVRGRRTGPAAAETDAYGRLLRLRHASWSVSYEYDSPDAQALPARLFAENADGMELRLRIDEWSSLASAGSAP